MKARGAFLHNIMPLISAPEHGTVFGLTGQRGPSAQELKALQDSCSGEMNMMRHCRQCRADAVGLLGEDRSAEFTTEKVMEMDIAYDPTVRKAYQRLVEQEREQQVAAKQEELSSLAGEHSDIKMLIAVATTGGGKINEHFGHATEFQIYEVGTGGCGFVGHRRVDLYCQGGYGEEETLPTVIRAINDCVAVFVAKVGGCPRAELAGRRHRSGGSLRARVHRTSRRSATSRTIWRRSGAARSFPWSAATRTSARARIRRREIAAEPI